MWGDFDLGWSPATVGTVAAVKRDVTQIGGREIILIQRRKLVPEENGRLHVRGAETAPQYVLDGVPLADKLTGTYATGMDT
jgi:hypothetical protein